MQTETKAPVWTISQITQLIKKRLESFFYNISIQGEISNFKKHSSGHMYFSLKDKNSQIAAVMFQGNAKSLAKLPKDGDKVIVKGEINVYPPRGSYQIVIRELQFTGVGALLLEFEKLKKKLLEAGLFDKKHKKTLPRLPKKIGIVTSPTGAAIQDIINVLTRRFSGLHIMLNPVQVQGEGAFADIAKAICQFNKYELVDVIIVGRGGGSIEDLWAFNEEIVAKAIFNSKIPIISAVGHETDFCISDFVADVRAPTPSAAAEIVIAEKNNELNFLKQVKMRLHQVINNCISKNRYQLNAIMKNPILVSPYAALGKNIQRLDELRQQIGILRPDRQLLNLRQKLKQLEKNISLSFKSKFDINKCNLKHIIENLNAVNPNNLLKKGYSILSSKDGKIISSKKDVQKEQEVTARLSDGKINLKVN